MRKARIVAGEGKVNTGKEEQEGNEGQEGLQQLMRGRGAEIRAPRPQGMPLLFFLSFVPFLLFLSGF